MNEHIVLNQSLMLAGVADYSAHHFDPSLRSDQALALQGATSHALVKILLAHKPRTSCTVPLRRRRRGLFCYCRATRMAGSFGRGIFLFRCSSRA